MTQASDLAVELDAEINDLAAACSATGNPNPLVTEVLDRMKATSAKLANVGGHLLDPLDEPEPEPAPAPAPAPQLANLKADSKPEPESVRIAVYPDPRARRL